jgi:hypothetical protein
VSNIWGACKDEDDWVLNQKCRLIKRHRAHASASITTRLTTIQVGRIRSAAEIARSASANLSGMSTEVDGAPSRPVAESPVPSAAAPERAAAPAAKSTRSVRARQRSRDPKGDGLKAFAYAPPTVQYGRLGDRYRSGGGAPKGSWGWAW